MRPFGNTAPEHSMQSHLASILMLLVTMVIWGSTFVVTKGVNDQLPPFTLAFVRVAIGALVLLACALIRQARGGSHSRWSALPWGTMISMGLIGVVLYYAVFNYSLRVHVRLAGCAGPELHSRDDGAGRGRCGCASTPRSCAGPASRCRWSVC